MPLSKSLTQPLRKNMLLIGSGWRGYFAPFDFQAALTTPGGGSNILDLEVQGPFNTNPYMTSSPLYNTLSTASGNAVPGWTDCGWIKELKVTNNTKVGAVRSGYHGAVRAQYRGEIGENCDFKFNEYGRLQYKIATGVQIYNILKSSALTPSTVGPLNSPGIAAVSVVTYTTGATGAALTVAAASGFAVGNYIVADVDYVPNTGGLAGENGAFAFPNAITDIDFIRKTSDFVARVTAINGSTLTLDQPFVGGGSPAATNGTPPAGAKVQVVTGWTAANGGTFIQEWSGLFIADSIDGAQVALYYPHLSISQFRGDNNWAIENIGTTDLTGMQLDATFEALAYDDQLSGETVVSYTGFYPNARVQNTY